MARGHPRPRRGRLPGPPGRLGPGAVGFRGPPLDARPGAYPRPMDLALQRVSDFMASLDGEVRDVGPGEWGLVLDAAGWVLDVGVTVRGPLLRAQAAVLPAGVIDPHQLLYWNRQAPLVSFAENAAGEVFLVGEIPLASLDYDMLDRFLGLLLTMATRAREFAIQNA